MTPRETERERSGPSPEEIDLSEFGDGRRVYTLLVDHILAELDDDRRAKLDLALRTPRISTYRIAATLTNWGHPVSAGAVSHWRLKYL